MEIKIQLEKNLLLENVIGTPVSEENDIDTIIGEIVSYDNNTGIAVCTINEKSDDIDHHFFTID